MKLDQYIINNPINQSKLLYYKDKLFELLIDINNFNLFNYKLILLNCISYIKANKILKLWISNHITCYLPTFKPLKLNKKTEEEAEKEIYQIIINYPKEINGNIYQLDLYFQYINSLLYQSTCKLNDLDHFNNNFDVLLMKSIDIPYYILSKQAKLLFINAYSTLLLMKLPSLQINILSILKSIIKIPKQFISLINLIHQNFNDIKQEHFIIFELFNKDELNYIQQDNVISSSPKNTSILFRLSDAINYHNTNTLLSYKTNLNNISLIDYYNTILSYKLHYFIKLLTLLINNKSNQKKKLKICY